MLRKGNCFGVSLGAEALILMVVHQEHCWGMWQHWVGTVLLRALAILEICFQHPSLPEPGRCEQDPDGAECVQNRLTGAKPRASSSELPQMCFHSAALHSHSYL